MVQLDNPYAPTAFPSETAPPTPYLRHMLRTWWSVSIITATLLVGAIVATCAAFINIESIIASGPIMVIIGGLQTWICFRHARPLAYSGIAVTLFAIGCFLTIFLNQWAPMDAQRPISIAIGIFTLLLNSQWLTLWHQLTIKQAAANNEPIMPTDPSSWT